MQLGCVSEERLQLVWQIMYCQGHAILSRSSYVRSGQTTARCLEKGRVHGVAGPVEEGCPLSHGWLVVCQCRVRQGLA